MIASHVRTRGFNPEILDCEAMGYTDDEAMHHISRMKPRLVAFGMYGQQPSASAQNMAGATRLARLIKSKMPDTMILMFGIYPSALPHQVLQDHPEIDFVCTGEGVYTISDLLGSYRVIPLKDIKGLAFRTPDGIIINPPSKQVDQKDLEHDLPGVAWDLLPMRQYRTALWHAYSNNGDRRPYASLYTSLNCPHMCSFCCISSPFGGGGFKYWSPEFIINELGKLADMGVVNIKFADEMWLLRPDHFLRTCELIIARGYKFNIWAYARVDTIKAHPLDTLKKAGVNWLALGIESANSRVRKDVYKGRFGDTDIPDVVAKIRDAGINVIGNYIFGLPEDDHASMQETLDLAIDMCTEEANFYSAMAYPGSALHKQAIKDGWQLPTAYAGYSQHSYYTHPLPTKYCTAAEVLAFRDRAWQIYHTNPKYQSMILDKFGTRVHADLVASTKIKLTRKLLGD
jgi:radical SAM superfamily enzyme YgiQ (UPF0313 family)